MGDWEDICEQHGKSMSDGDEWIFDMYSKDHEEYSPEEMVFKNLQETRAYAMKNKGSVFIKNPNRSGYILKV